MTGLGDMLEAQARQRFTAELGSRRVFPSLQVPYNEDDHQRAAERKPLVKASFPKCVSLRDDVGRTELSAA